MLSASRARSWLRTWPRAHPGAQPAPSRRLAGGPRRPGGTRAGRATTGRCRLYASGEPSSRVATSPAARATATGRRGVPLVLAAGVDVRVDRAVDDGHDLDAVAAHRARARRRRARRAGARAPGGGCGWRRSGAAARRRGRRVPASGSTGRHGRAVEDDAAGREGDGAGDAARPSRVQSATWTAKSVRRAPSGVALGELAGAVERVDDPHAVRGQPAVVALAPPRTGPRRPRRASASAAASQAWAAASPALPECRAVERRCRRGRRGRGGPSGRRRRRRRGRRRGWCRRRGPRPG